MTSLPPLDASTHADFPILLFAGLKDAANSSSIVVRLENTGEITVRELLEECAQQHPLLARWLPHVRVAVNQEYSDPQQIIADGDEIAFLPPVAGGSTLPL